MKTAINALLTIVALPLIWFIAAQTNDRWAYVAFGVCLMLWPCQWAFRLGQKSTARRTVNFSGIEFSESDMRDSLMRHPPGRPGADAARAAAALSECYGKSAD